MPLIQTPFYPAGIVKNVSYTGLGSAQWTNPSNATGIPNTVYATCTISNTTDPSYYLKADYFQFVNVPDNAPVSGIFTRITRKAGAISSVKDDHIRVFTTPLIDITGSPVYGDPLLYPGSTTFWDTTDGTSLYGGSGDLLGLDVGLSGLHIKQSGFGFFFSCSGSVTPQVASVDSLEMSVVWFSGAAEITNTCNLFLAAPETSSGNVNLFIQNNYEFSSCNDTFLPNQVDGMVGWWDAAINGSVFLDPITSGASDNNQPAGLWLNQVSNNNLQRATFTKKPTYFNNGTGYKSRPFIAFDGTDDSLETVSGIPLNGDFSIWLVNSFLDGDSTVNNTILSATGDLTTISQSGLQLFTRSNIASGTISHSSLSTDFGVRYIERTGNTVKYRLNGIDGATTTVSNVSGAFTLNSLGERLNTNFYKGNISALYIYNQRNTSHQQSLINQYIDRPCEFNLYMLGHIPVDSGINLFLASPEPISSGIDLFLGAPGLTSGAVDLYLRVIEGEPSGDIPLYIAGPILISGDGDFNIYTQGPMPVSGWMNLFVKTNELYSISTTGKRQYSPNLFIKGSPLGTGVQENSLNLFLHARNLPASMNLFIKVPDSAITETYMNLYVNGEAYSIRNTIPLYIGASGEIKSLPLYVKGRGFSESSDPFYPSDGFYPYSGSMNLFILRDPAEMLNLYLKSDFATGDVPMYIYGAFTHSSGINLVIPSTIDSGNRSQLLFTRGGV